MATLRPTSRRRTVLAICAGLAAVLLAGFALIYFVFFPSSSPRPFKLTTPAVATTPGSTATPSSTTTPSATGSMAGRWQIASGSQAGYRVREQLVILPAPSDAVGRTSAITGGATLAQSHSAVTITTASIDVAVNTLKSDRELRDEKLHTRGLESDTYPTATFTLAAPVKLPPSVLSGHVVHTSATGTLVLHGASRKVSIPLEMSLAGSTLQAVGSLTFPWGEFNMTAPSIGGFVTVTDRATMEFDLRLQRA